MYTGLRLALAVLGFATLVGCGSERKATAPDTAFISLPALDELNRLSSAAGDEFLIQQAGADFAGALGSANLSASGTTGNYAPNWSTGSSSLNDAAYGIYRLSYDPADAPITLSLAWDTAPSECWVALSDWTSDRWAWSLLPASGELAITAPARYSDPQQRCFVAVVALGQTPASLATIGFGEPPVQTGDGYTLFPPLNSNTTYLIDMAGTVVHSWTANYKPGATAELLENGNLLRAANLGNSTFTAGGSGGRLTEFDWDNNVEWYFDLSTTEQCTHHDFARLPNGNILMIVWNALTDPEIVAEGRDPASITSGKFWYDSIIEIEPTLPNGGTIVWEWHAIDHLVQDFDNAQENYGDPAQHPELIDVNFPAQLAGDWTHFNSVAYNAELDQIMLTSPTFCEVWVIDHSTTTAEAAGHSGGRYGRGGDLLYRWGNPLSYRAGSGADQQLFFCHHGHWIETGLSGAGDVLIFNNQAGRPPDTLFSTVVQLEMPINPDGSYFLSGDSYGPELPVWEYKADPPNDFYSPFVSSAQRLPGGETLICSGGPGRLFVVDATGTVKWNYQNEFPSAAQATVFRALRYLPGYPGLTNLP